MIEAELIHKTEILKFSSSDKIRQLLKLLYVDCKQFDLSNTVSCIKLHRESSKQNIGSAKQVDA